MVVLVAMIVMVVLVALMLRLRKIAFVYNTKHVQRSRVHSYFSNVMRSVATITFRIDNKTTDTTSSRGNEPQCNTVYM